MCLQELQKVGHLFFCHRIILLNSQSGRLFSVNGLDRLQGTYLTCCPDTWSHFPFKSTILIFCIITEMLLVNNLDLFLLTEDIRDHGRY